MTLYSYNSTNIGAGIHFNLGATDSLFLGESAVIVNTNQNDQFDYDIVATGSFQTVNIQGTAYAYGDTVLMGDNAVVDHDNRVVIGEAGYIGSQGHIGLALNGYSDLVENHGTVESLGAAVHINSAMGGSITTINNTGRIESYGDAAIVCVGAGGLLLENAATIRSQGDASVLGQANTGAITVVNTGRMTGGIHFGSGADRYDGRSGIIEGEIDGGAGNDTLLGGATSDILQGDGGRDILTGGKGTDEFHFLALEDSTAAKAGRDLITDFSHRSHDLLDVSAIDALAGTGADDSFTFVGTSTFSLDDAEIRYQFVGGSTFVYFNTDADKTAEMTIELSGKIHLALSDFDL